MDLDKTARNILLKNDRGGYTIPTADLYPFQWNWDSCFCALGWAVSNEKRAWQELEFLFKGQWNNGMLPHIIFHQTSESYFPNDNVWDSKTDIPTSGITQPPVAATAVRMILKDVQDKDLAAEKVCALLPQIYNYHKWFHTDRDPYNTGLVAIYHPWESGRDNNADWDSSLARVPVDNVPEYRRRDTSLVDAAQRPSNDEYDRYMVLVALLKEQRYQGQNLYDTIPFKVADLGVNSILLRANKDLLSLAQEFPNAGVDTAQIQNWIALQEQGFQKLWHEEDSAFYSYDFIADESIKFISSSTFLPFFAGTASNQQAKKLLNIFKRWQDQVTYLMPSLDPESDSFNPLLYWRGPIWAIVNFMIMTGLSESGHQNEADLVSKSTAKLLEKSGFWEYFNPITGDGLGGDDFSWTAAMWLYWARHHAEPL